MLLPISHIGASAADVNVNLDGQRVSFPDQRPFIDANSCTLVPIRFIAENMGANVGWNEGDQTVTISLDGKTILLTIGEQRALVDSNWISFDTSAVIVNGRTMVPLRFISEALGASVQWEGSSRTVFIYYKQAPAPPAQSVSGSVLNPDGTLKQSKINRIIGHGKIVLEPNYGNSRYSYPVVFLRSLDSLKRVYPNCNYVFMSDRQLHFDHSGLTVFRGVLQFEYTGREGTIFEMGIMENRLPNKLSETPDFTIKNDPGLQRGSYYQVDVEYSFIRHPEGEWLIRSKIQLSNAVKIDGFDPYSTKH